jgi:hypothetical protein
MTTLTSRPRKRGSSSSEAQHTRVTSASGPTASSLGASLRACLQANVRTSSCANEPSDSRELTGLLPVPSPLRSDAGARTTKREVALPRHTENVRPAPLTRSLSRCRGRTFTIRISTRQTASSFAERGSSVAMRSRALAARINPFGSVTRPSAGGARVAQEASSRTRRSKKSRNFLVAFGRRSAPFRSMGSTPHERAPPPGR